MTIQESELSRLQLEADKWGRDGTPVSGRNSSKGALVAEAHSVFRALGAGASVEEVQRGCVTGKILRHKALETRLRIWQALFWRYFKWNPPDWVLADLADAARAEATDVRFLGLAYLHYARRDRLTFDFVTTRLFDLWNAKANQVRREDVMDFLAEHEENAQIRKWRDTTRKKLAGNVLSALRDFGLLAGVQRKVIRRPVVPPEVVFHLCRLLHREGLRGLGLLRAHDWRLFLWDDSDVASALGTLAQTGQLRFERSGRSVILEISEHIKGEER